MAFTLPSFDCLVSDYRNTAEHNDRLHQACTEATWADPVLSAHRRHIEENRLGFGDPAFHSMWLTLLKAATQRFGTPRMLEIGVYKGQVISLWALLALKLNLDVSISAISPLAGQPQPHSKWRARLLYRVSRRFREQVNNGNFYEDADYEGAVRGLFAHWKIDFGRVAMHRGFSTDEKLLHALRGEIFHIVYVDGDHTFAGARHDFLTFGPKVALGGWLVADDAATDLPGSVFWKGHYAVTEAAKILPSLGFKNVLNVGHNRIYERVKR
jgi:hypothetical protein